MGGLISAWMGWGNREKDAGTSTTNEIGYSTAGDEDTGIYGASANGGDGISDITTVGDNAGSSIESESGDVTSGSEDYESCSDNDNAVSDQAGRWYITWCAYDNLYVQVLINVTQQNIGFYKETVPWEQYSKHYFFSSIC